MSDNYGGRGMRNLGQSLLRLNEQLFGFAQMRAAEEARGETLDRQELLQAQQYFQRRHNEWLAANNTTRFDKIESEYERFVDEFRNEVDNRSDLFTSDITSEAFHSWFELAASERRLPVQAQAAENRVAYHTSLYEDNLERAIADGDIEAVQTAVRAAVEDGIETPDGGTNVIQDALYQINFDRISENLMDQAREMGFENAVAALEEMPEGMFAFQVDVDEEGNPVYRELSSDDVDKIKDQVRDALDEEREEQEYQINRIDTAYAEFANQIFTNQTLGDLRGFKAWLEGRNPETGEQLPASDDPREGNARAGMKEDTWRTWYNMVNGAIAAAERDLTDEEEEEEERARVQWNMEYLRMVENDEDPKKVNEFVLQGVERGHVDPEGEARTLLNFNDSRNENPVYAGIMKQITARVNELGLSESEAQRVLTAAEDEFLTWFNNETVQRQQNGQWAYNMDTADRETQQKIAENIVLSAAPETLQDSERAAWAIREGEIVPSNTATSAFRRDEAQVTAEERLLAAIQRDEYLGWENLPGETGERIQEQLTSLWHGQARLFKELTGFLPMNTEQLDDRGRPIYVQTDRRTGRPRYFRFRIPTDEEGNLVNVGRAFARGGIRGAVTAPSANEILQVYNPDDGLYYDVEVRPESETNRLGGNVRFNARTDLPGWEP